MHFRHDPQHPRTGSKRLRVAGLAAGLTLLGALTFAPGASASGGVTPPGTTTPAPAPAPTATAATGPSWTIVQKATWYGPGFWGRETACGMPLTPTTMGVAHKKLPCGTQVTFNHLGRTASATVIDRGPFRKGYAWDLTKREAKVLGFLPVGAGPLTATVTLPAP
jgi:rare lipoprotein A (peptidoglycan hydrolase)